MLSASLNNPLLSSKSFDIFSDLNTCFVCLFVLFCFVCVVVFWFKKEHTLIRPDNTIVAQCLNWLWKRKDLKQIRLLAFYTRWKQTRLKKNAI